MASLPTTKKTTILYRNNCYVFFNRSFMHNTELLKYGTISNYVKYLESINCNFTANSLKYALITMK